MKLKTSELTDFFSTAAELFDLTPTQAKITLFLIRKGNLPVGLLSKLSGLPRNKIYESAVVLQQRGLIEMVGQKPVILRARISQESIDERIQQKLKSIHSFEKEIRTPSKEEGSAYSMGVDVDSSRICVEIEKTKRENWAKVSTWITDPNVRTVMSRAKKKGVRMRILGPKPSKKEVLAVRQLKAAGATIAFTAKDPDIRFSIFDDALIRLTLSQPNPVKFNPSHAVLWTQNKNLTTIFRDYFQNLWEKSEQY